jgi:hypothetical protein
MKTVKDIFNEEFGELTPINEALNSKQLTFIPVQLTKSDVGKWAIAVGNIFGIKDEKYCNEIEQSFKENLGIETTTGITKAKAVIKQNSTKLIYILYMNNGSTKLMICNSDICKPLDKTIKLTK